MRELTEAIKHKQRVFSNDSGDALDEKAADIADQLIDGKDFLDGNLFLFISEMSDPEIAEKVIFDALKESKVFRADMRSVIEAELGEHYSEALNELVNQDVFYSESP